MEKELQTSVATPSLDLSPQITEDSSVDDEPTLWKSIRKWPKVLAYSLGMTAGILLYGFDTSIVGNVSAIPEFQSVPSFPISCLPPSLMLLQARLWSRTRQSTHYPVHVDGVVERSQSDWH